MTDNDIAAVVQAAVIGERERCINVIAVQQRQYDGGSPASVALGYAAIAINNLVK